MEKKFDSSRLSPIFRVSFSFYLLELTAKVGTWDEKKTFFCPHKQFPLSLSKIVARFINNRGSSAKS
jgi:hypothetical protein